MSTFRSTLILIFSFSLFFATLAVAQEKSFFTLSPNGKMLAKIYHTAGKTKVRVFETKGMTPMHQWEIPGFKGHTIQFSPKDPNKLLIADPGNIRVYRIDAYGKDLEYSESGFPGKELTHVSFSDDGKRIVWATESTVYKTNLFDERHQKIGKVDEKAGKIRSIATPKEGNYVASQEGNDSITWFSEEPNEEPKTLKGHDSPVVGLASKEGLLLSLDNNHELVRWDLLSRQISRKTSLRQKGDKSEIVGVDLDRKTNHLVVMSRDGEKTSGKKYYLPDLLAGKVKPKDTGLSMTSSGRLYRTVRSALEGVGDDMRLPDINTDFEVDLSSVRPTGKSKDPIRSSRPKERERSKYELAKIEADNGDYQAALDFIGQVPISDANYRKSRELKKEVFHKIEAENSLKAAKEQYRQGNYDSSKIILENILIESPNFQEAKRYLQLTEKQLSKEGTNFLLLLGGSLLALGASGFLFWKYKGQELLKSSGKLIPSAKRANRENAPDREFRIQRRQYLLKLEETKIQLRQAIGKDREGKQQEHWIELAGKLKLIEQRAKADPGSFPELVEQLTYLQSQIRKKPTEKAKTRESRGNSYQRSSTNSQQKNERSEQTSHHEHIPDYYKILGVSERSSRAELKRAFRMKMKQYHPDKHNSSEFDWIRKEAVRMTRLIQEAYDVLSDPKQKRLYLQKWKTYRGKK